MQAGRQIKDHHGVSFSYRLWKAKDEDDADDGMYVDMYVGRQVFMYMWEVGRWVGRQVEGAHHRGQTRRQMNVNDNDDDGDDHA